MTIISVSGLIGSGKDTVSDYLVTEHGFKRESFAGTLKDAVAVIFGWDRDMLEGKTKAARDEREKVDEWWAERLAMPQLTPRWVLQYWGTEVCREGFHNDIWISSLARKLDQMQGQDIVISDSRFVNELDMLRDAGATTVCVRRGLLPDWWNTALRAEFDTKAVETLTMLGIHRSEWDWAGFDFDKVFFNDGSLADLYQSVEIHLLKSRELVS